LDDASVSRWSKCNYLKIHKAGGGGGRGAKAGIPPVMDKSSQKFLAYRTGGICDEAHVRKGFCLPRFYCRQALHPLTGAIDSKSVPFAVCFTESEGL
jgi:hypothetical protein